MYDTLSLQPTDTIRALLDLAKREIAGGEKQLRMAAEHIAAATLKGASQRDVAIVVGKSPAWVNRLLQWKKSGFQDDSPFGPQSRESRSRARAQSPQQTKRRVMRKIASYDPINIDARFDGEARQRMIGLLGMLASDNEHERASAAAKVENHRLKITMSWDQLIVKKVADQEASSKPRAEPDNEPETEDDWK